MILASNVGCIFEGLELSADFGTILDTLSADRPLSSIVNSGRIAISPFSENGHFGLLFGITFGVVLALQISTISSQRGPGTVFCVQ